VPFVGMVIGFVNPNGTAAFSPGLRVTSYPGNTHKRTTTLKGLDCRFLRDPFNPLGVAMINRATQGSDA
jgi:hypothetical protein